MLQFAGQNNAGNIGQMYPLTTTQGTNQYTNTNQASSSGVTPIIKHLFMLLTYKFFALFSSLYLLPIYGVVSYD